jgi:hypothetical protein
MANKDIACTRSHTHWGLWKILGGTALVLIVAGLVVNFPDVKRYIKISSM